MAGHGVLLVTRDGVVAHAGEVVVGAVVLAHVLQAETPVLVLAQSPLRRAMRRLAGAAGPLAGRQRADRLALLVGLHPYAIEERRVEFHDLPLCGGRSLSRKLDKSK